MKYNEYNQECTYFINIMGVGYVQEVFEKNGQATICEDGQPTKWCWESEEDEQIWNGEI